MNRTAYCVKCDELYKYESTTELNCVCNNITHTQSNVYKFKCCTTKFSYCITCYPNHLTNFLKDTLTMEQKIYCQLNDLKETINKMHIRQLVKGN